MTRPAGGPAAAAPSYLRTATTPRMLLLLLLLLGAAAVCAGLGMWQLDRAQERGAANERAREAALAQAPTDPLSQVLDPQTAFSGDLVGRKVTTTGRFGADELLVAGRALDGVTGYLVLTPLRTQEAGEPVLAVVRGWVADPQAAQALDPAPSGTVRVTGYLQSGEAGGDGGLLEGQVDAVSPAELVNRWGGPIYSGYLVLAEVEPAQDPGLALLPPPTVPGGGLNLQNLAYALQWWIFGGFAVLLWARLVRDETRAAVQEATPAQDGGVPDDDVPDVGHADEVSRPSGSGGGAST